MGVRGVRGVLGVNRPPVRRHPQHGLMAGQAAWDEVEIFYWTRWSSIEICYWTTKDFHWTTILELIIKVIQCNPAKTISMRPSKKNTLLKRLLTNYLTKYPFRFK
jgi:hypothetical protein